MKVVYNSAEINYLIPKVMGFTLYSLTEIGVRLMHERDFLISMGFREEIKREEDPIFIVNKMLDTIVQVSRLYGQINRVDYEARVDDHTHSLAKDFYDQAWAGRPCCVLLCTEDQVMEYYRFMCNVYFTMAFLYQHKEFDFEEKYAKGFYEHKLSILDSLDQRELSVAFLCDMVKAAWKVVDR
ncbi:hypothetical protein ACSBL2_11885 [Pedobacter sp. AW31-3R]|uniref:hypothetical protein n=1 Tax=Pedobacter sp. AW31-3R TaxID=3445781 RepID=UPI003FA0EA9E